MGFSKPIKEYRIIANTSRVSDPWLYVVSHGAAEARELHG